MAAILPDDIFKFIIFLYENWYIMSQISLKNIRKGPINNKPSLAI